MLHFFPSALLPAHIYWWTESKCHRCKISCPNAICPNIQPYLVFDNDSNIIEVEHSSPYIHIPPLSVVLWCHNIPDWAGWSVANLAIQCFQPVQIDNKSWKHPITLCNVRRVTTAIRKANSYPINESLVSPVFVYFCHLICSNMQWFETIQDGFLQLRGVYAFRTEDILSK